MPTRSAPTNVEKSIFLSYCPEDDEWSDRLISHLGENAQTLGVHIEQIASNASLTPVIKTALERAKVLAIFVTSSYLESSWITKSENAKYVEQLSAKGLKIIPVLLKECEWQSFSIFTNHSMFSSSQALASSSPSIAESILSELSALIVSEAAKVNSAKTDSAEEDGEDRGEGLSVTSLSSFQKSDEVETAMDRAFRLALRRRSGPKVTTSCLLFGLAEGGRTDSGYYKTPQFLFERLMSKGEHAYKIEFLDAFPTLRYPEDGGEIDYLSITGEPTRITVTVFNVFELAKRISLATRHTSQIPVSQIGQIGARHLLAALLVLQKAEGPIGAIKRLKRVVSDSVRLRKDFLAFIEQNLPDDDHKVWKSILIDLKPVEEPIDEKPLNDKPRSGIDDIADLAGQSGVAGFMTDFWDTDRKDLLGITRDVNALASLAAAYNVEPPLAIGLFGEWGSGKSHFMRQMKKRVQKLSFRARKSPLKQKDVGYCKNIVQIEFNAWHYIEGNLWASLVDHIFANLRLWEDEHISIVEARRNEMLETLKIKKELEEKLRQRVEEGKAKLAAKASEARTEAAKVQTKLDGVSQQLNVFKDELKTNITGLPVSVSLSKAEEDLLRQIGIDPKQLNSVRELQHQYRSVTTGWSRVVAQWRLFWKDPRVGRRWIFAALLVLVPVVVTYIWRRIPDTGLPTWLLSAGSFAATLLAAAKPTWSQFQKALGALEKREQDIEQERQEKERRVLDLQNELILLTREYADVKREADGISVEIAKVETAIKNTTATSLLAQFIEDRASATDYRRHLGLLAIIRQDFEKLQKLFTAQRKEEAAGEETLNAKKINRIVLYIDDLDRCPPDRVVQVLQAIHLLLAFPLFVVVVGVDSRWVTRSLQQSYEWLRDQDDDDEEKESQNGHKAKASAKENSHSDNGATPHDYLEKIFQIPFWLKPMDVTAAQDFIDGLMEEKKDSTKKEEEKEQEEEQEKEQEIKTQPNRDVKNGIKEAVAPVANDEKSTTTQKDEPIGASQEEETKQKLPDENASGQSEQTEKPDEIEQKPMEPEDDNEEIDMAPTSLTFGELEITYMKQLAPLIGRSPRAVKRFLNCYQLIKVRLTDAELKLFIGEEGESTKYKAVMLLLGVITGAPKVSSYVIEVLDDWPKTRPTTLEHLLNAFSAIPEIERQLDGVRLTKFLKEHIATEDENDIVRELVDCAQRVSRFSFRVVGNETLGQRNVKAAGKKTKPRSVAVRRTN